MSGAEWEAVTVTPYHVEPGDRIVGFPRDVLVVGRRPGRSLWEDSADDGGTWGQAWVVELSNGRSLRYLGDARLHVLRRPGSSTAEGATTHG